MAQVKQAAKAGVHQPAHHHAPPPGAPHAPAAEATRNGQDMVQELKVTGHMMALPAGLFCIVNEAQPGAKQNGGLPGVRISPPPVNPQNVEIAGFRPDGWLNAEGDAALVRIRRGPAQVLVTIYQLPNQTSSPKLQVRQLLTGTDAAPGAPNGQAVPAAQPERMDLLAHIQSRGDVGAKYGDWLGEQGSGNWIEGFAIAAPDDIDAGDLSYQAVLGRGWLSPWVESGQYCGSRGMALPLLGLRIRLTGEAAEHFDITYSASFVGGAVAGPAGNDETCEADSLAPLEALHVTLTPRVRKHAKPKR